MRDRHSGVILEGLAVCARGFSSRVGTGVNVFDEVSDAPAAQHGAGLAEAAALVSEVTRAPAEAIV